MQQNRLRELDFLRGIAILLVLLRHGNLFDSTTNMGWIGVDLFFVLSGFLVSKLLFKEYSRFGNIEPKRFLIRRGFKIYPIYFLFYIPYLILRYPDIKMMPLLGDLLFMQNYVYGWGYAFGPSWSLAVEEHFYFGFALLFFIFLRHKESILAWNNRFMVKVSFERFILLVMLICLSFRILSNFYFSEQEARNFTMTHLRIDSLLTGVLVSYLHHFKMDAFKKSFFAHRKWLFTVAILGLSWTPFMNPVPSFFAKTFGFTLLYISFGIVLTSFLLVERTNQLLDQFLSRPFVNVISKIGFASYSIYIIHTLVNSYFHKIFHTNNHDLFFAVTSFSSILIGWLMTHFIEKYFLGIRDRYYPART